MIKTTATMKSVASTIRSTLKTCYENQKFRVRCYDGTVEISWDHDTNPDYVRGYVLQDLWKRGDRDETDMVRIMMYRNNRDVGHIGTASTRVGRYH